MSHIHEKSPCCHSHIHRFGSRRRQCASCKKTWRVWKKQRGRKRHRLPVDLLFRYFKGELGNTRLKKRTRAARLRSILQKFNEETPWPEIPEGPLVIVADALIEYIEKKKYAVYFILIRSIGNSQAFIFPPSMRAGGEVVLGWHEAFSSIPRSIFGRVRALVCDGHGGLVYLAKRHGLALQRCHFHLLARIAHNASTGPLGKNKGIGIKLKKLIEVVLYGKDQIAIYAAIEELKMIKKQITSPNFRTVISGFIKNFEDYRSYLNFPAYNLPTTSNTAEHLVGLVRDLQYRARGFRTPESLFSWITALCKYRRSVTCRAKIQPN